MSRVRSLRLAPRINLFISLALVLTAVATTSCGGTQNPQQRDEPIIRVDCKVIRAVVIINDRELGTVRSLKRGIQLSPGTHRLVVRHPNFHTHYQVLKLQRKERRIIEVELAQRLP